MEVKFNRMGFGCDIEQFEVEVNLELCLEQVLSDSVAIIYWRVVDRTVFPPGSFFINSADLRSA